MVQPESLFDAEYFVEAEGGVYVVGREGGVSEVCDHGYPLSSMVVLSKVNPSDALAPGRGDGGRVPPLTVVSGTHNIPLRRALRDGTEEREG